jgi:hypothetical protein
LEPLLRFPLFEVFCSWIIEPFRTGVFRGNFPGPGGAEDDESFKVHGRAEGVHIEEGADAIPGVTCDSSNFLLRVGAAAEMQ